MDGGECVGECGCAVVCRWVGERTLYRGFGCGDGGGGGGECGDGEDGLSGLGGGGKGMEEERRGRWWPGVWWMEMGV